MTGGLVGFAGYLGVIIVLILTEAGPYGQTPGKHIVGIRVLDTSGQTLSKGMAVGRHFAKIVSGLPCYVGCQWPLWERREAHVGNTPPLMTGQTMSTSDNPTPLPPSSGDGGAFPRSPHHPQLGPPYAPLGDRRPFAGRGPGSDAFAGFWIRLLGVVIDGLLLSVVTGTIDRIVTGGAAVGFVVAGAYFSYFHSTPAGQTVGNRVVGIRVVDAGTGGHLDRVRALLRWLMSYVSGIALFIGYLWMLWDPAKQTWHDSVANSYVVKASHYPPPAAFGKPASSTAAQ